MFVENVSLYNPLSFSEEENVGKIFHAMEEKHNFYAVITSADGQIVGILTPYQILRALIPKYVCDGGLCNIKFDTGSSILTDRFPSVIGQKAKDIMSKDFIYTEESSSLLEVASRIVCSDESTSRFVVVFSEGKFKGIVTSKEIIKSLFNNI